MSLMQERMIDLNLYMAARLKHPYSFKNNNEDAGWHMQSRLSGWMAVSKQRNTLFPSWLIHCTEQQNYAYSYRLHIIFEGRGRGMWYGIAYNIVIEWAAMLIFVMHTPL